MHTQTLGPPPLEDEGEEVLGPDGTSGRSRLRSNYCGIEVVSKLKIGTRVRCGPDWKWGEQVRAMPVYSLCVGLPQYHPQNTST